MSDKNDYIPFFRSYAEFYWRLGTEAQKAGYIDMILNYAFNGVEPSVESETFGVFTLIKPNIDRSLAMLRARAAAGSKKTSAKGHPGNKHATKSEQNQNKIRTEKEKEKEIPVLSSDESNTGGVLTHPLRARGVPLETVLMIAHNNGVPEEFAREFHAEMARQGWQFQTKTNTGTRMADVCESNVGCIMGRFYNYRKRFGKKKTTAQLDGVTLVDDDFDYSRFGGQK